MVVVRNSRVDDAADPFPSNGGNLSDATSCISSAEDAGESGVKSDGEPSTARQRFPYYSTYGDRGCCYHPGRDATVGGMDNRAHYASGDKAGTQYPAIQSENGALIYFMQGIHPGYNLYNPYLPITMVADGQYVQQFYSPYMMLQPSIASPGYLSSPLPCGESVPSTGLWSPSLLVADGACGNGYTGMMEIPGPKVNMSSPSKSSLQMLDISSGHGMHNQFKHVSKVVSTFQSEPVGKGYFPVAKLPSHAQGKGGEVHPNGHVKANAGVWSNSEEPKAKSKINSTTESGLFNEQNHGPRETDAKSCLTFESNAAGSFGIDGNGNSDSIISVIRRDQYNLSDFSTKFDQGFFFVIKSYSEDDVHKSIKYNVWASTTNGNKRLDSAYQEAQEKIAVESSKCPVFLFFSVNASGQFCGVAEMIGRVDFNKKLNFWQQDKWNGCFPVKWHILKDVPNPRLRHIILENNEHKPVTNSRDTQEVRFNQGVEMLNIFKTFVSKTSILDDFDFYESRQRIMQEKRQRLWMLHDHIQQKADEITTNFGSLDITGEKMENGHQANE